MEWGPSTASSISLPCEELAQYWKYKPRTLTSSLVRGPQVGRMCKHRAGSGAFGCPGSVTFQPTTPVRKWRKNLVDSEFQSLAQRVAKLERQKRLVQMPCPVRFGCCRRASSR